MQRRCPHQKTQTNHYFKLCTINLCLCSLMWAYLLGAHIFSSAFKDFLRMLETSLAAATAACTA